MTKSPDSNSILLERGPDGLRKASDAARTISNANEIGTKMKAVDTKGAMEVQDDDEFGFSAASLQTKVFPPLKFSVPGLFPEGLSLFAGKPKVGKSWFLYDCALAVASGTSCWTGEQCEKGDVLYLALEDNQRRLQSRIAKLHGSENPWPERLRISTEWPRANDGGHDKIRRWLETVRDPRLICIDVLAKFRSPRSNKESNYDADYEGMHGLHQIASDYRISLVGAHHLRKNGAETDPFEKVSGTLGLTGGVDTVFVLDQDSNGLTLHGRGRDLPEIETAVRLNAETCRWEALGNPSEVWRTRERSQILSALIGAPLPMSPKEIAVCTGMDANNVAQLLFKMMVSGEVSKVARGRYVHPSKKAADGP